MGPLRLHQDNKACCLGICKPPNLPRERLNVDLNKGREEEIKLWRHVENCLVISNIHHHHHHHANDI